MPTPLRSLLHQRLNRRRLLRAPAVRRGDVRQSRVSEPFRAAEICGCEFTADGRTLFLTVQHPGAGGSARVPISHWPDGGDSALRPSLVAIVHEDRDREIGT